MQPNIILLTDSYKVSHYKQYPAGTTQIYSYFESRGGQFENLTFFGLQYYLKEYLAGQVVTQAKLTKPKSYLRLILTMKTFLIKRVGNTF